MANTTRINIIAAIDYSEASPAVVEHALALARLKLPCDIHFIHVSAHPNEEEGQECSRLELIDWLGARLPSEDELSGMAVIAHEASGKPAQVILQMASDLSSRAIVLGTHGRTGLKRLMLGSVAEAVSARAPCSVLIVRGHSAHAYSELEPPCALCIEARLTSQGYTLWCSDHAARNDRRHTRYGRGAAAAERESLVG
jgi:nucleotide-binding universal stress UspA family protein